MSDMWRGFLLGAIVMCTLLNIGLCVRKNEITNNNELLEKIDSLNLEIDKLRDKNFIIVTEIDSSEQQLRIIEKWYEEKSNYILTQPLDSDIVFFRDYILSTEVE